MEKERERERERKREGETDIQYKERGQASRRMLFILAQQ